jgi:hypothetical protein
MVRDYKKELRKKFPTNRRNVTAYTSIDYDARRTSSIETPSREICKSSSPDLTTWTQAEQSILSYQQKSKFDPNIEKKLLVMRLHN